MHIDFIHAAVSAALMLATLYGLRHFGVITGDKARAFDWRVFIAILFVMFILNLVWPASGSMTP